MIFFLSYAEVKIFYYRPSVGVLIWPEKNMLCKCMLFYEITKRIEFVKGHRIMLIYAFLWNGKRIPTAGPYNIQGRATDWGYGSMPSKRCIVAQYEILQMLHTFTRNTCEISRRIRQPENVLLFAKEKHRPTGLFCIFFPKLVIFLILIDLKSFNKPCPACQAVRLFSHAWRNKGSKWDEFIALQTTRLMEMQETKKFNRRLNVRLDC